MYNNLTPRTMRTLKFSLLAVLFVAFAGLVQAQDKFEKKYHEEYDVKKGETFEISNKFGDINIENTSADKITIDAVVIVKASSKEKADKVYDGFQPLLAEDIADIIYFVTTRPAHVNIADTLVFPTAQASASVIDRSGKSTTSEQAHEA